MHERQKYIRFDYGNETKKVNVMHNGSLIDDKK